MATSRSANTEWLSLQQILLTSCPFSPLMSIRWYQVHIDLMPRSDCKRCTNFDTPTYLKLRKVSVDRILPSVFKTIRWFIYRNIWNQYTKQNILRSKEWSNLACPYMQKAITNRIATPSVYCSNIPFYDYIYSCSSYSFILKLLIQQIIFVRFPFWCYFQTLMWFIQMGLLEHVVQADTHKGQI